MNVDSNQAFRSDMDWNDIDETLLSHFQRLGQIRQSNPVIGTGRQRTIDTHTCMRYNDSDSLLIVLKPIPEQAISVEGIFPYGTTITELYTGQTAKVNGGTIKFPTYNNNVAVIRE